MNAERPIFEDFDADVEDAADLEAIAELENGQSTPHAEMREWLLSWGKPDELEPPSKRR